MAEYCQTIVLEAASKWHPVNSSVHPPSLQNPDNIISEYFIIHLSFKVREAACIRNAFELL